MAANEPQSHLVLDPPQEYIDGLAALAVEFGANVQRGQVVGVTVRPGQEPIYRAVAELAYARGAKFVDAFLFDSHLKRSRLLHSKQDDLGWLPPWIGGRILELGEMHAARIGFEGEIEPNLLADIDPELLGLDMLPRVRESGVITGKRLCNWTLVPYVTPGWASIVYPDLPEAEAYVAMWDAVASICRLDADDPVAAWQTRHARLNAVGTAIDGLGLDAVRLVGPGTDLTVGLFSSSRWISGSLETIDGIRHAPNIPTEEVFTAPDPTRVDGYVTATKPLLVTGAAPITGLRVRFEGGRAVEIDADSGASILRSMADVDDGGRRIGELALVDRDSRVGQSGKVFSNILLDENSASHIALGRAYPFCIEEGSPDMERVNVSDIHIDFMIGSDRVDVTGVRKDGTEVPLLRGGEWQII